MANFVSHHLTCDNIEQKLVDAGVVKITGSGKDHNGSEFHYGLMDMKACNPKEWEKEEKRLLEKGVLYVGDPAERLNNAMIKSSIVRWQERKGNHITFDEVNKMPAKELDALKAQFKAEEVDVYAPIDDMTYRRDYRPDEIERLHSYQVQFSDDGNDMRWFRAWKSNDDPAMYASDILKDEVLHYETFYEGRPDVRCDLKGGQACTPDGRSYHAQMDIVAGAIKPNPKNAEQSVVRFHYGQSQQSCMIYVQNQDIVPMDSSQIYNGKARSTVYLTSENYKAYGLDKNGPKTLSAKGIVDGYNTARKAYKESMSVQQAKQDVAEKAAAPEEKAPAEKPKTSPKASKRAVPNDLDAVNANMSMSEPSEEVPFS